MCQWNEKKEKKKSCVRAGILNDTNRVNTIIMSAWRLSAVKLN